VLFEDRRRAGSFGDDASLYDRARPSYPTALVGTLVAERPRRVLDVGCGTGISGRLFVAQGCDVLGVEPDGRMASVARQHGLAVEVGSFEAWDAAGRTFDLVACGQAWHWVDPVAGAAKAASVLRPGGRIGLFWNQGHPQGALRQALDAVYRRIAPRLEEYSILLRTTDVERLEVATQGLEATGAFAEVQTSRYPWSHTYTRREWIDFLLTHSDHRALEPATRTLLLDEIGAVIDDVGGEVTISYNCWLVTARKGDGLQRA
jgi:SAM-dependent methyltransferase